MGKSKLTVILLLCLVSLAACGGRGGQQESGRSSADGFGGADQEGGQSPAGSTGGSGQEGGKSAAGSSGGAGKFPVGGPGEAQLDVVLDGDDFDDAALELKGGKFLGMQFYKGEPVQLWASAPSKNAVSVYLYREDGTSETVLEKVGWYETTSGGYLDDEGNYYGIAKNKITKWDSSEQKLFSAAAGGSEYDTIEEICCAPDGRTAVLAKIVDKDTSFINMTLMELGQDGVLKKVEPDPSGRSALAKLPSYAAHLGTWGEDLLLMDGDFIYKIDLQAGTLAPAVSLAQTSYVAHRNEPNESQEDIKAVYIPADGRIELAWAFSSGEGRCENLTFRDMTKERETITLSGIRIDSWLKGQIAKFNSANDKYYITIKTTTDSHAMYDFRINTGIEIATGKGPELLFGEIMLESVSGMIEKGGLVDLAPMMERDGIKEEDYFPMTFRWRTGDAVYGIFYKAFAKDCLIKADVLGDVRNPDMETLLDALLAYPEQACLGSGGSSAKNVLRDLLYASDTLYGMLDWEAGTCDFSGELFPKMLEVAKRYEYSASKTDIAKRRANYLEYNFQTRAEIEAEGYVPVYYIFDDGIHPVVDTSRDCTLYINANSAHPEGAWEFISFILSEESQKTLYDVDSRGEKYLPVMKKYFFSGGQEYVEKMKPLAGYSAYEITQENVEALAEYLEDARELSWKTEPIIEIIVEEASGYFNGIKEIGQVRDLVQNRAQLYMDERH